MREILCGRAAIHGIITEGEETIEEYQGSVALDAGLISWAQLGYTGSVGLFDANLPEEFATNRKLTQLGKSEGHENESRPIALQ